MIREAAWSVAANSGFVFGCTMIGVAEYLLHLNGVHDKVLGGLFMTPLGFERSDGLQNLTESLFAARVLPPGIYVVIHNQAFPVEHVRKDQEHSRFIPA